MTKTAALRVIIQQPALPAYRVPVFRELARRDGVNLKVLYGRQPALPNSRPEGFVGMEVHEPQVNLRGVPMYWSPAQMASAGRGECDVLVLTWDLHYASLLPALTRARLSNVACVLWGHGYSKRNTPWRAALRRVPAHLAESLVLYTDYGAELYRAAGFAADRVFVAKNCLDQAGPESARRAWLAAPDRLSTFQRENDLVGNPLLLFVARLSRARGLELLLEAMPAIIREVPNIKLCVIGDGPLRPELERQAQARGIAAHIHFSGAIYDEDGLAPWFLSARAFVFPLNIGLSVFHAFGYGVPVVTSGSFFEHNPEIEAVRDGHNGLMFEGRSADSLAAAVLRIVTDPNMHAQLSRGALETAQQHTIPRMVDGLEAAIRAAHSRGRARSSSSTSAG